LACGFVAVFFCFSAVFLRLKPPLPHVHGSYSYNYLQQRVGFLFAAAELPRPMCPMFYVVVYCLLGNGQLTTSN
jgi:hypothetical protein